MTVLERLRGMLSMKLAELPLIEANIIDLQRRLAQEERMTAIVQWTPKQIDLVRRTVAKDCDAAEFDQFMHICRAVRLDPLRRQIYAFVFNKHKPEWRQMTVVTAIGGYRAIAERTGNYRPDEKAARIEYNDAAKDPKTNPLGIVRCEVTVYKRSHGEWFPVAGEANWDEYVPLKDGVIDSKKTGWTKMPRIMIAKCAEANALRRAWPDDFSGLEVEEEVDRRTIELTATELADEASSESKLALVGGKDAVTVQWEMNGPLARVPIGRLADSVLAWANAPDRTETEMRIWWNQNLPARTEYKAKHGAEYLEFQRAFEAKTAEIEQRDTIQAAE